ncbi:hypothetical protein [Flavobacterium sp.]|uniref:hypothetical protein n=2 Tax=Flavobacterium sp. TaxID=239 RepID=UPI00404844E5
MKKIILVLTITSLLVNCKKQEQKIMQNPNITANNIVDEIIKNIKHHPSEKIYTLDYSASYTFFEFFVNDIPARKEFKLPYGSSAFEINPFIFRTGKYNVKYKMYPVGKVDEDVYNTLIDESYLEIELASYNLKNQSEQDITYSKYKTPMDVVKITEGYSEEKFVGTGKTYYEGSFDIEVDVPYEIHPAYEKGKDLHKMDKKELEEKLLKAYQQVWDVYNNKEYDNIARISFDTWKDEFSSLYKSKEDITEIWNSYLTAYKSNSFEMQPIVDYKLEFFGNGKLVALMSTNPDFRNRGNTVLWAKVKHNGALRPLHINSYFYIPQGETEFKVY